ncbi:hypothetical protein NL532_25825 [Mesorhizobium sp. C120A]|uniref:hypothetical protein n=1 Tax=unclassified Mesorhizobium TaxID=325217 RepID=UPI0012DF2E6E|nr:MULTISPECIES: hypothetical protein [unclassified Mesorhizobium]WJI44008.1 hypothetical protein NL532_25825 [Mesorhizobium sp. C120A]
MPDVAFQATKKPGAGPGFETSMACASGGLTAENQFASADDFENFLCVKAARPARGCYDRRPALDPARNRLMRDVGEARTFGNSDGILKFRHHGPSPKSTRERSSVTALEIEAREGGKQKSRPAWAAMQGADQRSSTPCIKDYFALAAGASPLAHFSHN